MTTTPKILIFAGSARRGSFNKKLAQAAAQIAETKACGVTLVDLANYVAPVYNGDDEAEGGKYIGLMATSPGGLGGIRMLPRLRESLADLGAITLPGMVSVGSAMKAFDEDGQIMDEQTRGRVEALIDTVVDAAS